MTLKAKAAIWTAYGVFALALLITVIVLFAPTSGSAPRQSQSPIKYFADFPDGYSDIIAGCIGVNGYYTNHNAQLVITPSDPNCRIGGALNTGR